MSHELRTPLNAVIGFSEVLQERMFGELNDKQAEYGVGIAPEDQAAVFEEFRQVGSGQSRREGTGLGLTLAKKLVELHGGRIRVKSPVGEGSTFTVSLPVRPHAGAGEGLR